MAEKEKTSTTVAEKDKMLLYLHGRKLHNDLPDKPETVGYYVNLIKEDLNIVSNNAYVKSLLERLEIPWSYAKPPVQISIESTPETEELSLVDTRELAMLAHFRLNKLIERYESHIKSEPGAAHGTQVIK